LQIKRDLDIAMNDFLKEESVSKEKATMFQVSFKQVSHSLAPDTIWIALSQVGSLEL
jgi:hypothetical protein